MEYDAVVVGSGPNGLGAAISLQKSGLKVLILEAKDTIGGGMRTSELTIPGFLHDVCSAVHPLAAASPYFRSLPLKEHGLNFVYPEISAAHPFDDGSAACLRFSLEETARSLGIDYNAYAEFIGPVVENWPRLINDILGPFGIPKNPVEMISFGMNALKSATQTGSRFMTREARGLWAGMAAHSMQPLESLTTSAVGMVLLASGHTQGWPVAEGGSGSIARALASIFKTLGGKIETDTQVRSLSDIPPSKAILFDLTPRQVLAIAGNQFSPFYRWQLQRHKYGMGVFKIDWALESPIPFKSEICRKAGTIHLGNTMEEIALGEKITAAGHYPDKPFVLLAQQSLFDRTRAPEGKHTGWAYCHVPNGSEKDMTQAIESQVERFAPGFRDLILARHTMNSSQMQEYNANYIGGDINGGVMNISQLFNRPVLSSSPYRTSAKGIYICSASTPPGGGVHGMSGYHAASRVLKDLF